MQSNECSVEHECGMKSCSDTFSCPMCLDSGDNRVGASPKHRYNLTRQVRTLQSVKHQGVAQREVVGRNTFCVIMTRNTLDP